ELRPEEVDAGWLDGCDVLHVSGYALARTPVADAAERLAQLSRTHEITVSADVSAATLVDAAFLDRLDRLRPDVLFATDDQRAAIGGGLRAPPWGVERGQKGCTLSSGGGPPDLPVGPGPPGRSTGRRRAPPA